MASKTTPKAPKTTEPTKLTDAQLQAKAEPHKARAHKAATAFVKSTLGLGRALLPVKVLYLKNGRTQDQFLTDWAMPVTGLGRSQCWSAVQAAEALKGLPASAGTLGLSVESLREIGRVPEGRQADVFNAVTNGGKVKPTTDQVVAAVKADRDANATGTAKRSARATEQAKQEGMDRKLREPVREALVRANATAEPVFSDVLLDGLKVAFRALGKSLTTPEYKRARKAIVKIANDYDAEHGPADAASTVETEHAAEQAKKSS